VWPSTPDPALAGPPIEQSEPATTPGKPEPTTDEPSSRTARPGVPDKITGLVLPESDPVAVSIPRIGARSRLVELGVDPKNGEMEVPEDPAEAGWFVRGASPGALGPAVIAGHVTWDGVPSVFYRLGTLEPGDRVSVTRKDGRTAVFSVTRVAQFAKSRFPTRDVYGAIDHAGLRLVTCGGTYDRARKRYLDNVIVFARLDTVRGPGG
jgi:sortase (surface protein transpeptidase)